MGPSRGQCSEAHGGCKWRRDGAASGTGAGWGNTTKDCLDQVGQLAWWAGGREEEVEGSPRRGA